MVGADDLSLTLLDGFEVRVGAAPVIIKGVRSSQVLAYLALHQGTTVSAARLSDALWGHTPPASARNSIQRFISDLRRDLGPARSRIESAGNGYRLTLRDADWCDADELERALPLAREALADGRPIDAMSLVGGVVKTLVEPLASVDGAAFVALEQLRLREVLADCGEVDGEARLAGGDTAGAAASARRLLDQHPYRERLCITLATALTRLGRANDALETIVAFRRRLRDDLGLEPSPEIEQTELDILLHRDAEPLRSQGRSELQTLGAPARLESTKSSLSVSLIGRQAEVVEAIELLETKRAVTFTGTGGIGKTSMAKAVAERWESEHGGTSRFVSFEDTTAKGLVASVGRVVGTSSTAGADPISEVVHRICSEVDLLVLDNCEHLVEEIGGFIDHIVKQSSEVRILVTSRRPLGKVYEQVLPLRPLDDEASRLLLAQQLERSGSNLRDLEPGAVVELLEELDGLPLAIELASSSLRSVGVLDLLSRWRDEASPDNDPKQLRHLSIANAVASTLGQLDELESELLDLCALFPGDFDAAAIEALAGTTVVDELASLCDHSLLEIERRGDTARYRMLVPIRSEIRLSAGPLDGERKQAFVAYFQWLASDRLEDMKGTDSLRGVGDLRTELNNIATAFNLADDLMDLSAMSSIVGCLGLANGMSPSIGAKSHLQAWGDRLRECMPVDDMDAAAEVQTAAAWGLYGSSDGAWYQRWEAASRNSDDVETQAMAAIARFSCGESAEAWALLGELDLTTASDSYMRAMLCGVGAVIAFEVGAVEGTGLADAAAQAASERPSHGASFFADLANSTRVFVRGDTETGARVLEAATKAIDGHGLVTLENMGLASLVMTVGLILDQHDPADLLVGILDRYLEQHSLDPASVAMTLDVAALHLDRSGRTADAATLLGLLDRLGLSMAILRGPRLALDAKVDSDPAFARARAAGSTRTTFDVLRSIRVALADVVERTRTGQ